MEMQTLNCSICYQRYDNSEREAIVLPCGHTFCSICTAESYNKCATCRKTFHDDQLNKNYIVYNMLEELNAQAAQGLIKSQGKDRCTTHLREIDRFCKPCFKLMCSVCHCPHIGITNDIISDMNLREEVERIVKAYKDVGKTKEEFSQKINDHINQKTREMENSKEFSPEEITSEADRDIKKVLKEEEENIQMIEEEAFRKICEIEANKQNLINEAKEVTRQKIREIETRTATLFDKLYSDFKRRAETVENDCKGLKAKLEALQDLSKYKKATLEECLVVYEFEQIQRAPLNEFFCISNSDIDSLLVLNGLEGRVEKKFEVGETVDYFDKATNEWVRGTVKQIQNNQVVVQNMNGKEEWFDIGNLSLLKKWKKGNEFHIGNRIYLQTKNYGNLEARVVKIKGNEIKVFYMIYRFDTQSKEWIPKDSDRIFEFQY